MAISKELGFQECMRLLHTAAIGRVALATPEGPHIIPVNYSIVDEAVIVATSPRPWVSGTRNLYLRIPCSELSGRSIGVVNATPPPGPAAVRV